MPAGATRANRVFGALLLAAFGTVWLELWCAFAYRERLALYLLIAVLGALLIGTALRVYLRSRPANPQPETPQEKRRSRVFHLINAAQWVGIFVGINIFNNIGLARWDLPLAIAIIGLHFLPLARLFARPAHYVTGAALLLFAAIYPAVVTAGPQSPVGFLGTGLVLWTSAVWAVSRASRESD